MSDEKTFKRHHHLIFPTVSLTIILILLPFGSNEYEDMVFPEMRCESSRKALFKDLDGSALGLEPPVSVFPKSDWEWPQFYLHAGKTLQYLTSLLYHGGQPGHNDSLPQAQDGSVLSAALKGCWPRDRRKAC